SEWLTGGLTTLGVGAKTASGYGHFAIVGGTGDPAPGVAAFTLELETPGFFAGAGQKALDCQLRPASPRGMLRWWWRTLHSGYVDVATLRCMEGAVWGNTKLGGAARFTVEPLSGTAPVPYDRAAVISRNHLPKPPNTKTTQGLIYHSFGMDDK